jgi:uncharacterized protein
MRAAEGYTCAILVILGGPYMKASGCIASMALLTVVAGGGSVVARDRAELAQPRVLGPQEAEVVAVVVDQRTQQPTIVLQGKRDRRYLAMAVDFAQVPAIALPLQGVTPPRPLTHDLFLTLFGRLKVTLNRVVITDLRDDVYYATLHLTNAGSDIVLDARPSDAIALAVRAKAPVLVEDRVFDQSGTVAEPQGSRI